MLFVDENTHLIVFWKRPIIIALHELPIHKNISKLLISTWFPSFYDQNIDFSLVRLSVLLLSIVYCTLWKVNVPLNIQAYDSGFKTRGILSVLSDKQTNQDPDIQKASLTMFTYYASIFASIAHKCFTISGFPIICRRIELIWWIFIEVILFQQCLYFEGF